MNPLPVIPTPSAHRWREFRIRALPFLVFVGVLVLLAMMWRRYVAPPSLVGQVEPITAYVTSPRPGTVTQAPNEPPCVNVKAASVPLASAAVR